MNFTPLVIPYFWHLYRRRSRWATPEGCERVQRKVLKELLRAASDTEQGRRLAYSTLASYEDFRQSVPRASYEDIRPQVMRMVAGEKDVLWPGRCTRFAQSSGTNGGKSKYIPVTPSSLRLNHYGGSAESLAAYLNLNPDSKVFGGRCFILGGSFANELSGLPKGVRVGDLSANLIEAINPVVNLFRVPPKRIALLSDWEEKLPALIRAASHSGVSNISGVPSWFLTVLRGVLEYTGRSELHQVWPNLEVFFHGGISFGPYRAQYDEIIDPSRMHYHENYNASEGFFAAQETPDASDGMRLLLDIGVFYEFVPIDNPSAQPVGAWQLEPGHTYEMLISSCNGLWRYSPGDTVKVESVEPLRISIAGRTNCYINAFGEELMVWNAEAAMDEACKATGALVADYTAAPVYTTGHSKGRHQWLIEWHTPPQCGEDAFANILDAALQKVNSDYQAKRSGDIFLSRLELTSVPPGTFDHWLEATGKLGGQRKIPRLSNDRHIVDHILRLIK